MSDPTRRPPTTRREGGRPPRPAPPATVWTEEAGVTEPARREPERATGEPRAPRGDREPRAPRGDREPRGPREPRREERQPPAPVRPATRSGIDWSGLADAANVDRAELDALMAEFSPRQRVAPFRKGQRLEARVSRVTPSTVFFDVGGKADAAMERVEVPGDVAVGDVMDVYVLSTRDGELKLTRTVSGDATRELLGEALENRLPVQGKVTGRNDGGFEVLLSGGVKAFCPTGQIDRTVGDDLDGWIGRSLAFRVIDLRGREPVVSHKVIAEDEARADVARRIGEIAVDSVLDGEVTRLADFGAFVRVAEGIEGLVRVPNLSRQRVNHPSAVVKEGQAVKVRVLGVDAARGRLDLGIRQAEDAVSPREARVNPRDVQQGGSFGTLGSLLSGVKTRK